MALEIDTKGWNKFNGCFEDFSTPLQESIKNIIKNEGYVKYNVETKTVPQAGNFLSYLYEVDITGETADGEKITPLFIKKPMIFEKNTLSDISDLFSRESFIYNDLPKIFEMLQDAADIPDGERFALLKSYDCSNDGIIMENLSKKGFTTYHKTQVLSLKYIELCIIQLAKFHALSHVIKNKIPKYFDEKIRVIKSAFNLNSDWDGFVHNICTVVHQVLQGEAKTKIANYAPRCLNIFKKYIKYDDPSNGCLCHGDYKFHNIMVKETDGEVSDIQPIDYQLIYYGNPVNDFLFFIFTCTDQEFRRKHLSSLKDLYFETFAKFLTYFNIDVDSAYSRKEFEQDYDERLELGLAFGLLMSAFTFSEFKDDEVSKLSLSELPLTPNDLFTNRVRGVVEDFIDWGRL